MIFRFFAFIGMLGLTLGYAQLNETPTTPESTTPTAASDADKPETEPEGYRAPAPPVDQDDSRDAMMQLQSDVEIKVGDRLEYMVLEDREPPAVFLVDEDGEVDLPLIGEFPAVGRSHQSLALAVSDELKKNYYYQATVLVNKHQSSDRRGTVWVMGEVNRAGMIEIPPGDILRVTDAIMRAGGFNLYADSSRVSMIRPDSQNPEAAPKQFDINVAQILETGRLDQDLILRPNDRVFVTRRGDTSGQYTLSGAINQPGVYPISMGQKITLSEAILVAGGFTQFGDGSDVKLIRYGEDGSTTEREINVDDILKKGKQDNDVLLQPGDRIIVGEVWARLDF